MRANRFQDGGYKPPRKYVCRVWNCRTRGFGRWCTAHTPSNGAGVLICLLCDGPLADHPLATWCNH